MIRIFLFCVVFATGIASAATPATLATVNGTPIPMARFDAALRLAVIQGSNDSPELRAAIRGQLIAEELLRQEAVKKKLQNDPAVLAAREEAARRAMIERYVATAVKPEPVGDADIRARYDTIVASLGEREYKIALIAVASEAEARQLLDRIKRNEAGFAELARRHSLLPNRNAGGSTDWLSFPLPAAEGRTAGLPLAVARVVASLGPGAIAAEPIAVEGRQWLVRLEESRVTQIPDYAAVRPSLRQALEKQALERASAALMQRLLAAARIE
jgi:parvulin-like peptidyl-prolyl isomerase